MNVSISQSHELEATTRSGQCDMQMCPAEKTVVVEHLQRGEMHVCLMHGLEIHRVTQKYLNGGEQNGSV